MRSVVDRPEGEHLTLPPEVTLRNSDYQTTIQCAYLSTAHKQRAVRSARRAYADRRAVEETETAVGYTNAHTAVESVAITRKSLTRL
jgi:hypothetical protein